MSSARIRPVFYYQSFYVKEVTSFNLSHLEYHRQKIIGLNSKHL